MRNEIKRFKIYDEQTGEFLEEYTVFIGHKKKVYDKDYVKIFPAFLSDIVENDEIAGKAIRLLFYMFSKMNFNDFRVYIDPDEAIQELNISKKTYYRWINDLINFGIIKKVNPYCYEIRANTAFKGEHNLTLYKEIEKKLNKGEGK